MSPAESEWKTRKRRIDPKLDAAGYDNGSAQPNLSAADVERYLVPLAPPDEQAEIIRQVEKLFALADTIERRVRAATARAEKLPQAILSTAFSGELVPTEAELAREEGRTYETAEELLARGRTGSPPAVSKVSAKRGRRSQRLSGDASASGGVRRI